MSKLIPEFIFKHVTDITTEFLQNHQFQGVILDIDNTLAKHNDPEPDKGVADWVQEIKNSGIQIVLISNNGGKRVESFAKILDCPFIAAASKPARKAYIAALQLLGTALQNTVAVGDQIFTDVWGANRAGITSILVTPIAPGESFFIKLKRKFEYRYIKKYYKKKR